MAATILDGTAIANEIIAGLHDDIRRLAKHGTPPRLCVIRANDNKGSASYAKATAGWCEEHGIGFVLEDLGPDVGAAAIVDCINRHNRDAATSAIMLHMPVPEGVDGDELLSHIHPQKDAEGMHPVNLAALLSQTNPVPAPCTAIGAVKLALHACPDMSGKRAVVCGRSQIVGRPAALLLVSQHATVTVTHTRTPDVGALTREADILIAATGAAAARYSRYRKTRRAAQEGGNVPPPPPDLTAYITADMVKPGAVVIDVGVNRVPAGFDGEGAPLKNPETGKTKLVTMGDVDFEGVREVAGFLTTAKGGTGPMTNAMLLRNTVAAARRVAGGA